MCVCLFVVRLFVCLSGCWGVCLFVFFFVGVFVCLFACLLKRSARTETHLGLGRTRLEQNAQASGYKKPISMLTLRSMEVKS